MIFVALILFIVVSIAILIQDISTRSVVWYLFPLHALLGTYYCLQKTTIPDLLIQVISNVAVVAVLIALAQLYFIIKSKKFELITDTGIGLGDILFMVSIGFYLSTVFFIVFLTFSFVISLAIALLLILRKPSLKERYTVPLAGYQAICLMVFLPFYNSFQPKFLDLL